MKQYIGLDLHAKTFTCAVVDEQGVLLWAETCPTSGDELVRRVTSLAGAKMVVLEEGQLAHWAFRILSPHAQVVVADPRENHWIARDEKINDETAARKLIELARMGLVRPVYHTPSAQRHSFKQLVQAYHDHVKQTTRYKNKIKAKFRANGIPCAGSSVYGPADRDEWRAELSHDQGALYVVQMQWDTLDYLEGQKRALERYIRQLARQFPQIERFQQVPGVGLIRAATFFAIIDTPHRFATKGKLWGYCGIGVAGQKSGQSSGPEHLTYYGNRTLKDALKGAALTAINCGPNPFAHKYRRQCDSGLAPELARLNVARSIANTLWAMWRRDEDYQPDRVHPYADDDGNENGNGKVKGNDSSE